MSYNRRKLLAALRQAGVSEVREGGGHTIVGGAGGRQSSVPRHAQLNRVTVRKIVKQLGLSWEEIEREL